MGASVDTVPFPCKLAVICEGWSVNHHFVRVSYLDDRINMIEVLYNSKKMNGDPIASHTLHIQDAVCDHSYFNNPASLDLAAKFDENANIVAYVDETNAIVYEKDPSDPDKGITSVVYVQRDAPVLTDAKHYATLDKMAGEIFGFCRDLHH